MTALAIRNLWMEYGPQVVLEGVSLAIAPRAFVALVGPSGCGKSTFLRLLLGQERPTRGTILMDGDPLPPEPGPDRGVVYQRYSVFPHLTALENVMIGPEMRAARLAGRLWGARRRALRTQAEALLAEVGLTGAEARYPAQLSGGMQQRLALAQALMMRPRLLLLDEPFGALDPGIRTEIHGLMRRLWHAHEMTVVMVTHDLSEAFGLATRVIAFDRTRTRPEERERYGATVTNDIEVWPPRKAGVTAADDADPSPARDDPGRSAIPPGTTRHSERALP